MCLGDPLIHGKTLKNVFTLMLKVFGVLKSIHSVLEREAYQ